MHLEELFCLKASDNLLKEASPIMLAFLGDAVHTLYVRDKVVKGENLLLKDYHKKSSKKCNARAQAKMLDKLTDVLTHEELDIIRRARNVKVNHIAKNSDIETYKKATSFEALIGYLYLKQNFSRLNEILSLDEQVENLEEL